MKYLTVQIDDGLDLRLRVYAANLNTTKAEAACRALVESRPSAALVFVNATKDLKKRVSPGGMVYVFALPH